MTSFPAHVLQGFERMERIPIQVGNNRAHHHPLGIWVVVVGGNVYIRSWTGNQHGWSRLLKAEPVATVEVEGHAYEVRAVPVQDAEVNAAVSEAYHRKYDATWSSYADDMAKPTSVATTMQLVPQEGNAW